MLRNRSPIFGGRYVTSSWISSCNSNCYSTPSWFAMSAWGYENYCKLNLFKFLIKTMRYGNSSRKSFEYFKRI